MSAEPQSSPGTRGLPWARCSECQTLLFELRQNQERFWETRSNPARSGRERAAGGGLKHHVIVAHGHRRAGAQRETGVCINFT